MAGPPPLLREDRLTLEQLGRMAREYDQISRGEHWPAVSFVRWLADEARASVAVNIQVNTKVDEAA